MKKKYKTTKNNFIILTNGSAIQIEKYQINKPILQNILDYNNHKVWKKDSSKLELIEQSLNFNLKYK